MTLFDERFGYFGSWKGFEETARVWCSGRAGVGLVVVSGWSVIPDVGEIGIGRENVGRWSCVWWRLDGRIP